VRDALSAAHRPTRLKVVAIGNAWRGDDGVGLAVAERLRGRLPRGVELVEREGEPSDLIDAWHGEHMVWVVDAVRSGVAPGTVHRLDASERPLPAELFRGSTHHLGLPEAVELARALDRLPPRFVVYGVEGERFEAGAGLSDAVARAVPEVAKRLREEVESCTNSG
jgi:hydrogenase maturation protease